MKIRIFTILAGIALVIGCSAANQGNYNYAFIRQEVELASPKVYLYEVKIGELPTREMRVYVHQSREANYIIVDSEKENGKNSFEFKKKSYLDNWHNYYRKEWLTISTFEEALNEAVSQYIQDNFTEEIKIIKPE